MSIPVSDIVDAVVIVSMFFAFALGFSHGLKIMDLFRS